MDAELEPEMRPIIERLLTLKSAIPEFGVGQRIDELNEYIDSSLVSLKEAIDALPPDNKAGWERLNALFLKTLGVFAK
jgi:predicted nucleotidyltransferase